MTASGIEIDRGTAARAFGDAYFNLLRRGANGSLTLSSDHWRLQEATDDILRFTAREPEAQAIEIAATDVDRYVWDRLPKQQVRSQIRVHFMNGDRWTFSGTVNEVALPQRKP